MYVNELITSGTNLKKAINEILGQEHDVIGFCIEYPKIIAAFNEITSRCGGKFIKITDTTKKESFLIGLIDYNQIYYNQAIGASAWFIEKLPVDICDKLLTIGNDTYLFLFCMLNKSVSTNKAIAEILGCVERLYPEYHFIILNSTQRMELRGMKCIESTIAGQSLYHFLPQIDMMNTSLPINGADDIHLALPSRADFFQIFNEDMDNIGNAVVTNYVNCSENAYVFEKNEFSETEVVVLKINYEQLLLFQRFVNIFNCKEHVETVKDINGNMIQVLLYTIGSVKDQGSIWNKRLKEMVLTRNKEWRLIADVILMYPVVINNVNVIRQNLCEYDSDMISYMHYLNMRLQCETGVPYGHDGADMMARLKKRVRRYYLGAVKCRITEEMIMDIMDREDVSVGSDIYVQLIVSVDEESNVGVLYVVSLSSPFLLSHLLDNVVRNQLMVAKSENQICNLYEYIMERWSISISGTPKSYVTVPMDKSSINDQQLAALLMSETIYEEGEEFSQLVDKDIINIVTDKYGMGQYDIAYVGVMLNTFVQFYPTYRGCKRFRLFWNSVTAFYIELILFEEAAITRFNKRLVELMSDANKDQPEEFLKKNRDVTTEYLNTVEFWDVQLNYPSSQQSIQMIKEAFNENALLARMNRYQEQVRNIFEINKELVDRQSDKIEKDSNDTMNAILFILTIVSTVSAIYQIVDYIIGYLENTPQHNLYPIGVNVITMIVITLVFIARRKIRKGKNKN